MSRRFLDDNIQLKSTRLPVTSTTTNDTGYDRGHTRLDTGPGTLYVNEGNAKAAIWTNFPANRYRLKETFQRAPLLVGSIGIAANPDFEIQGTNAANAGSTFAAGGGITITTTTAANDQVIIAPNSATKQTAWASTNWPTTGRVVFETNIKTGASIAATIIWAGLKLTNTGVVATDDDQIYVRYQDTVASGAFQIISSNNNTDTTYTTNVTVAVSTAYHIKIIVDNNRVPSIFINGTRANVPVIAALRTAINLIPYIGVQTTTSAAKAISVRGLIASKDLA